MKERVYLSTEQRLQKYTDISGGASACWPWQGGLDREGYGKIKVNGHMRGAHCVAYEVVNGVVPEGHELDHVCHSTSTTCTGGGTCLHRRCINPRHLEAVSHAVNSLRSLSFAAINARLDTCRKGHPFDEANTYRTEGKNSRACRACQREAVRRYAARKLAS